MLQSLRMFRLSALCALFLTSAQVTAADTGREPARGTLIESTFLGSYTKEQLNANFQRLGLEARNGVRLFRVNYQSQISPAEPRLTAASGLVIVPDVTTTGDVTTAGNATTARDGAAATELPWISLQHGTVASKKEAPSLNPGEGLYEASQGFVTAVMDYIGYGSSAAEFHPYLIEGAYVPAGVDLLRATRSLISAQGLKLGKLFLKGYSEGGYATMALQKALETEYAAEFSITASAPAAGPYDLEVAALTALSRPKSNPLITSFLVLAYDQWLAPELDLDAIFALDTTALSNLYTSGISSSEIMKALPLETRGLIEGPFLDDFLSTTPISAQAQLIRRLLVEQSLNQGDWVPRTPTRLYHCADDEIVAVAATENALAHFKGLNAEAPVSAVIAQSPDATRPYSHGSCPLVFASVGWFKEFLTR
ncbi:MAG TPA: lipase family protein [Oligoflexus sp.]|uniref:alpha/beta hydrolase n=1 Tax=Oligoflexus sp. TaxID=1971216 RepID=UPI002D80A881|nr:lipase family protein [Oligoflexus sp.]HET9238112.1 lipase family protein [Oligoflexus sp.]